MDSTLSGLNLNGHELAVRLNLGEAPEKTETEEETQEE